MSNAYIVQYCTHSQIITALLTKRNHNFIAFWHYLQVQNETTVSTFINIKTEYRSRPTMDSELRICLSETYPRINLLCSKKQPNPSTFAASFVQLNIIQYHLFSVLYYLSVLVGRQNRCLGSEKNRFANGGPWPKTAWKR